MSVKNFQVTGQYDNLVVFKLYSPEHLGIPDLSIGPKMYIRFDNHKLFLWTI